MRNIVLYAIFGLIIGFLIPKSLHAQDFSTANFEELKKCIDATNSNGDLFQSGWYMNCGSALNPLEKCITDISGDDSLWNQCIVQSNEDEFSSGSRSYFTAECALKFKEQVFGQITAEAGAWPATAKCDITQSQYEKLPQLYTERNKAILCRQYIIDRTNEITNGQRDAELREFCQDKTLSKCKESMSSRAFITSGVYTGHSCAQGDIEPTKMNEFYSSVDSRFKDLNLAKPATPIQQSIQNSARSIIESCAKKPDGSPYDTCDPEMANEPRFAECVMNKFRDVPYNDPIWSCNGVSTNYQDNCIKVLQSLFKEEYTNYMNELRYSNTAAFDPSRNLLDGTCGGNKSIAAIVNNLDNVFTQYVSPYKFDEYYSEIQEQRDDNNIPLVDDPIFEEPQATTEVLQQAQEVFNCGFAGTNKNKCCTNTVADFNRPQASSLNVDCFIPNPFNPDGCFLTTETVTDPLLSIVAGSARNQMNELTSFIGENGNVPACFVGKQSTPDPSDAGCVCNPPNGTEMCFRYLRQNDKNGVEFKSFADCYSCLSKNIDLSPDQGLWMYTALGCIDTSISGIAGFIFSIGLGIAGTVSLFCIIFAAIQMQLSQGNPEQLQKAQGLMTSCITGLIVVIFSVMILQVVGVEILKLPGWG